MKQKTVVRTTQEFLRYHAGRHCCAVFTGYSWRAFCAYLYLLEAYSTADCTAQPHLLSAMRCVLATLQETELPLAHLAIAALFDWGDQDRLWSQIAPNDSRFAKIERKITAPI